MQAIECPVLCGNLGGCDGRGEERGGEGREREGKGDPGQSHHRLRKLRSLEEQSHVLGCVFLEPQTWWDINPQVARQFVIKTDYPGNWREILREASQTNMTRALEDLDAHKGLKPLPNSEKQFFPMRSIKREIGRLYQRPKVAHGVISGG